MKRLFTSVILGMLFIVQSVSADVAFVYSPVTVATDDCEKRIYFDLLIDESVYTLNTEINTQNFMHVTDITHLEYLNNTGYMSYSAYYPNASVEISECHARFYDLPNQNIASYKIIAYDQEGRTVAISDEKNVADLLEANDTLSGGNVYYYYDVTSETFELDTHTYPQDHFYIGPNFYLIIFGIILVLSPGVLWVLRKTKML
ncbi:MAG: hypothetical protein UMR38_04850 [Candidatus Izemoplasma sp.]|nr:hypothetical protein [Candidatus Izemoplasma sp.]